ncbi:MAG: response regulator [Myxococcota bacterium]|jgi:two-component system phosphate regulon response regulator PhoB|nr:response regulator [Myxococcota bacterium]
MTARILAVDDEPDLLELVRLSLSEAGFAVETAASGREALEKLQRTAPDLVVLDLMLPDMSGTEVCRWLRGRPELADLLVLMLTAKSEEVDRVVGFELGADDYVTKPFSPRELVLRVRALLRRRAGAPAEGHVLERELVRIDLDRHRCHVDGEEVILTAKEFQLLATLMRKPGRVLTRERLLDEIWGSDVTVTLRTIDTHLKRLREKLGKGGDLIETVRGVGYRFAE